MNCHGENAPTLEDGAPIVLVGNPNVGKSALFGRLTGRYVTVANYPGTTVEVARGTLGRNGERRPVVDTPGMHSTVPLTEDERVARDMLLDGPAAVVQVADAKNLRRGLLLALELAEARVPFVLALNMSDEAQASGILIDPEALSRELGVPVVPTVATTGGGVPELEEQVGAPRIASRTIGYDEQLEAAIARVAAVMPAATVSPRALAIMALSGDDGLLERLAVNAAGHEAVAEARRAIERATGAPAVYALARRRLEEADTILDKVLARESVSGAPLRDRIGRVCAHPVAGWPVLLTVLAGMFLFVGVLGAGKLVGLLENDLFGRVVNPAAARAVDAIVPVEAVRDFLVGRYGLITMALTYGLAIVMPIVATFFLAFGVLEDSGYLPRLAVMLDRAFRVMGLNGRAVIPMILGLGCDTMATVTTRTLDSKKERLQVTLLLALAVPCSAQLGVILGMISSTGAVGIAIWSGVVAGTLLGVGWLAGRVLPGTRSDFIVELPPMRVPSLRNIAVKTTARLEWYLKEVIPVFVIGTAFLFALDRFGLLGGIERALSPVVVGWLGLPSAATGAMLIGFLRRDYGAAGLFALAQAGMLSPNQILVSLVVITLFVPCIANLMMIVKEHGRRTAAAVAAFVFPFAVVVGGLLNLILKALRVEVG